jgi:hypothetical protein
MLTYRKTWGEDRVFFEESGRLRAMPAGWTDVAEPPVFVSLAAGRAHFRPDDLLRLVDLVQGLLLSRQMSSTARPPQSSGKPAAVSGKLRRTCKKKNAAYPPRNRNSFVNSVSEIEVNIRNKSLEKSRRKT